MTTPATFIDDLRSGATLICEPGNYAPVPWRTGLRDVRIIGMPGAVFTGEPVNDRSLLFRECVNIRISGLVFDSVNCGVTHRDCLDFAVEDCEFMGIGQDAIRGGGSSRVLVARNYFHDFNRTGTSHVDSVQFWTANTDRPARQISIIGNRMDQADGTPFQGPFVRDENDIGYEVVTMVGNTVVGGLGNSFYLENVNAGLVADNTGGAMRIHRSTGLTYANNDVRVFAIDGVHQQQPSG